MKNRLAYVVTLASGALAKGARIAAIALVVASVPSIAAAQNAQKLDSVLRERASRLGGWSRVIVEFKSEPDVRVFGRGIAGRKLGTRGQVGEVENTGLVKLAADARVA